jgi:RimJ/RimL family protein N-acetyltransferase
MGFTLSPKHQGVGYASEAVTGIIDYLFKTLHKQSIIASVDPRNQKSIRLLERTGLRQESHFRETFGFNNEWPDDLIYAVFAEEWIKNNPY